MLRLRALGPALIVAAVVMGPGSILTASRVGADFGYGLVWVLALAATLMAGMTALAAHLGVTQDGTPCTQLARRAGRPAAAAVGGVLFLVVACFQFSNNVGVLAALEPLSGGDARVEVGALVALNLAVAAALFGRRHLYRPVERLMKVLVGLMAVGFLGNLFLARPSLGALADGLVPRLPEGVGFALLPRRADGALVDPLLPVVGLVGTTFSVAGAFYQAYLVRAKGWGPGDLRRGRIDSLVGIAVLGFLSLTVMATAAATLHGEVAGAELTSAGDVARQLEPLFGARAQLLFGLGLFGGAFSSFLVNAMIGGVVLSDGLGLGSEVDGVWARRLTVLALGVGLGVAVAVRGSGWSPVQLVLVAQGLTVIGNPVLAGVLLWLATRPGAGASPAPRALRVAAWAGLVVVTWLAVRTGARVLWTLAA